MTRLIAGFRDWLDRVGPDRRRRSLASVERLIADPGTEFLLADAGGPPSGVCQLRYRHSVWTGTPDCWLEDLFVEEHARGRGVGRALVDAALERGPGARRGAHRARHQRDQPRRDRALRARRLLRVEQDARARAPLRA